MRDTRSMTTERVGEEKSTLLADRYLLVLLVFGLLARVVATLLTDDTAVLIADDKSYVERVEQFMQGEGFKMRGFVRPPFYFGLLALIWQFCDWLGIEWVFAIKLVQCVAGTATAIPVYASALALAGRRTARFAVAFLLLDPTLIAYTQLIWPDIAYALIVAIVFDGVRRLAPDRPARALILGALTGAALLTRPVFGLFTLLLAGSWLKRHGPMPALRLVLIFGGTAAIVISPWVVHNQLRYGPTILIENLGPYNLWIGNDPRPPTRIFYEWFSLGDPVLRSRVGFAKGTEAIADDPSRFAARAVRRAINLWGFEYFVVRQMSFNGYGAMEKPTFLFVFWILQIGYTISFLMAAIGLPTTLRDRHFRLLVLHAALFTIAIAGMVSTTRYRVGFQLVLAIASGVGLSQLLDRRVGRREWIALGLAALLLVTSANRPLFRKIGSGDFQRVAQLARPAWSFFRY
jgi:4-amino-4-deoxy-L-arabinose transferase-like glycosyltransferase